MIEKIGLSQRTNSSKKSIGRSVSINGVHAVDLEMKQSENLNDPLLDINFKLNNPIGRLYLALQRIWKSQNTIISLRFTIPLIVLPIAIYVCYLLWQGRGVSVPMSKLGVIHAVSMAGNLRDVLVLPTSDVYVIDYASSFPLSSRLAEKPVIVSGTYHVQSNTLRVDSLTPYSQLDLPPITSTQATTKSVWDNILDFITQFK